MVVLLLFSVVLHAPIQIPLVQRPVSSFGITRGLNGRNKQTNKLGLPFDCRGLPQQTQSLTYVRAFRAVAKTLLGHLEALLSLHLKL